MLNSSSKNKINEQKRIQDEKDKREADRKRNLAHKLALQEKAKELSKKKYTYDFNGNLLFMKRLNQDALPKNTIHLPYTWHLSDQELKAIADKERRRRESIKFRARGEEKPKADKGYKLPQKFEKPLIGPKFEYNTAGSTFDRLKPKCGVTVMQNKRMKRSSITVAESQGKLTRNDYYDRVANLRTINTPKGIITTGGDGMNFFQTLVPKREEIINIENLDDYFEEVEHKIEPIPKHYQTEPKRMSATARDDHHVRISGRNALNEVLIAVPDKQTTLSKCQKPKINIASKNVECRVNTASGRLFRSKKLDKQLSEKLLNRRNSRKSLGEKLEDVDIMDTLKSVHDKYNYQLTYGFGWNTGEFSRPVHLQDIGAAKKPKSRKLHSSASVRNNLHQQRINMKSQNMKRGVKMAPPPFGKTTGHGLLLKADL